MSEPVENCLPRSPVDDVEDNESQYIYEAFDITPNYGVLLSYGEENGITEDSAGYDTNDVKCAIYKHLDKETGGYPLCVCKTFEVDANGKRIGNKDDDWVLVMGHFDKPATEDEKKKVIDVLGLDPGVRSIKVKIPFIEGPEKMRNFYVFGDSVYLNARVRRQLETPEMKAWHEQHGELKETQ